MGNYIFKQWNRVPWRTSVYIIVEEKEDRYICRQIAITNPFYSTISKGWMKKKKSFREWHYAKSELITPKHYYGY